MAKGRVLITGSSGFLGRNLLEYLDKKGWKTYPFDKINGQDLLSDKDLFAALAKVDYICHLAAVGDVYLAAENPKLAATIGVAGTANLIHIANKLGKVKKIVYASTWEVYGQAKYLPIDEKHPCNPDHPYSISKYAGELMVSSKLNHIPWAILRLGSAYGPYMRSNAVIPLFINKARESKTIMIAGDGLQTRQFTYAADIARAFELSISNSIKNEVFNIIASEKQTIKQIAEMVNEHLPVEISYGPKREGDVPPAVVSSKKAKRMIGWSSETKFKEGFKEVLSSYMNRF